jgi:hypothetical protein
LVKLERIKKSLERTFSRKKSVSEKDMGAKCCKGDSYVDQVEIKAPKPQESMDNVRFPSMAQLFYQRLPQIELHRTTFELNCFTDAMTCAFWSESPH